VSGRRSRHAQRARASAAASHWNHSGGVAVQTPVGVPPQAGGRDAHGRDHVTGVVVHGRGDAEDRLVGLTLVDDVRPVEHGDVHGLVAVGRDPLGDVARLMGEVELVGEDRRRPGPGRGHRPGGRLRRVGRPSR
jgi:hypothetical protein